MQHNRRNWFSDLCVHNGLMPTDYQLEQLEYYVNLLLEWNRKINLISRKDEENIWSYHILQCIALLFKVNFTKNSVIVDIGTGGGLPGVPLKIMRPDISMLCIDSTGKKVNAVLRMISDLELEDINVVWGRAEEVGLREEYLQKFDFTIARAVAPLNDLISWSNNFLKKKTKIEQSMNLNENNRIYLHSPALLAFKGGDLSKEIEVAQRQHPQIDVKLINLTFADSEQFVASDKKILIVHMIAQ